VGKAAGAGVARVSAAELTRLDPRFISLQRAVGWYRTAAVSAALLVGFVAMVGVRRWYVALPLWLATTGALAYSSYRWPAIEFRHIAYRVDEEGIEIHSGVFWRAVSNIPRSRVQHTDVAQGPLERRFGLGRLIVYTAGTQHSRVELAGLEHQTALSIRDHLLPQHAADVI
jgi:uncharacterized protein